MAQEFGDKSALDKKAKHYSLIKYSLAIFDTLYLAALLFLFMGFGFSKHLSVFLSGFTSSKSMLIALYFLIIYLSYFILSLPLSFYQSFILEHKFALSSQRLGAWIMDQLKVAALSCLIGAVLIEVFYYIVAKLPDTWWLAVAVFWIFFNLILAKLAPVIIVPLFFKYKKLSDELLRGRLVSLASRMGIKILDVFEIDFSKKTMKANAGLIGLGSTKRVILADTLKDKYTADEIEVILAHEFAHYKLNHLLKLILINCFWTAISFYLVFVTSKITLAAYGLDSVSDIAGFPVIIMYLVLAGLIFQPLQNYISRVMESNADLMALQATGFKEAFISMMGKLSSQNLSDVSPHPLIKAFFFDHPSSSERIAQARSYK